MVLRVENRRHQVLQEFRPAPPEQALPLPATQTLLDVMRGVVDRGTGAAIRSRFGLPGDLAGKTGTTQDNTDGWFILMHPRLVAGAWVGFNDARITMGDSWGPGARNALLIVGDFFKQTTKAKLVDTKAKFNAPHDTSQPDPAEFARMMELATGGLQLAPAAPSDPQMQMQAQVRQAQAPVVVEAPIVLEPPPPDPRAYRVIPAPPPDPQGGTRILRAY
jgi:penicillin-binding protein 1A